MNQEIIGCGWAYSPDTGIVIGTRGGVALTHEFNELEQSIWIILSTAPGQRVMRPTFGCRLHELVFSPNNRHTAAQARRFVETALGMWEPRIRVRKVEIYPHEDQEKQGFLQIEIDYEVKMTHDQRSLVFPFYLIPDEGFSDQPTVINHRPIG